MFRVSTITKCCWARFALNDAVVSRGASPRIVTLELTINQETVDRIPGDGLIVSTPYRLNSLLSFRRWSDHSSGAVLDSDYADLPTRCTIEVISPPTTAGLSSKSEIIPTKPWFPLMVGGISALKAAEPLSYGDQPNLCKLFDRTMIFMLLCRKKSKLGEGPMRMSKSERQAKLLQLIREADISTAEELVVAFNKIGLEVTQATISRDIRSWASLKIYLGHGLQKYVPMERSGEVASAV